MKPFLPDYSTDTFSGEICSSADETDDVSRILERHASRAERIEFQEKTPKKVEKMGHPAEERKEKGKAKGQN